MRWTEKRSDNVSRETSVFLAPAHAGVFGIAALEARAVGAGGRECALGITTFIEHGRDGLLVSDDHSPTRWWHCCVTSACAQTSRGTAGPSA